MIQKDFIKKFCKWYLKDDLAIKDAIIKDLASKLELRTQVLKDFMLGQD